MLTLPDYLLRIDVRFHEKVADLPLALFPRTRRERERERERWRYDSGVDVSFFTTASPLYRIYLNRLTACKIFTDMKLSTQLLSSLLQEFALTSLSCRLLGHLPMPYSSTIYPTEVCFLNPPKRIFCLNLYQNLSCFLTHITPPGRERMPAHKHENRPHSHAHSHLANQPKLHNVQLTYPQYTNHQNQQFTP